MKNSSIAVETLRSTSKSDYRETNEQSSSPILHHDEQQTHILLNFKKLLELQSPYLGKKLHLCSD